MKSPDERRAYQAAWKRERLKDPEARAKARKQNKACRDRHIEARRAADRALYARDPEKRNSRKAMRYRTDEEYRERLKATNRARYDPRKQKDMALRRKYGISLIEYERLVDEHDGHCHCCGEHHGQLVPDHSHETGAFRGLLCGPCNRTIGHAKECPTRLLRCIEWLNGH